MPADAPDETWKVTVFLIPQSIVDDLSDDYFDDMNDSEEIAAAILALTKKHTDITKIEVKVAYERGELKVSPI